MLIGTTAVDLNRNIAINLFVKLDKVVLTENGSYRWYSDKTKMCQSCAIYAIKLQVVCLIRFIKMENGNRIGAKLLVTCNAFFYAVGSLICAVEREYRDLV
jgi:hypothetical protein